MIYILGKYNFQNIYICWENTNFIHSLKQKVNIGTQILYILSTFQLYLISKKQKTVELSHIKYMEDDKKQEELKMVKSGGYPGQEKKRKKKKEEEKSS